MRLDIEAEDSELIRFKVAKKDLELSEKMIQEAWKDFEIKEIFK